MKSGIYRILNLLNDKFYIGSAKNIDYRWSRHFGDLNLNKHYNSYLQSSWNKYGRENFKFEIIEECEIFKLIEREQFYMDLLKPHYNLSPTAGSTLGFKFSDKSKKKIGLKSKGRTHSEETKAKMSATRKGKTQSKESILKSANARRGFKHTEEAKLKISISKFGKRQSEERVKHRANKNKKLDKWPHELGRKCRCQECMQKKREYYRNWKKSK